MNLVKSISLVPLKCFVFLVCFLFIGGQIKGQCPTGTVIFSSQIDITNFATNYPNCIEIPGDVVIGGNYSSNPIITNLTGLSQIISINGSLNISSNSMGALTGLNNLTFVGEDLILFNNDNLDSLTGLENIAFIGEDLVIRNNDDLISLMGLDNLDSIGKDLIIGNNNLVSLTGIDNLTFVGEDLVIENTPNLVNLIGLDSLEYIGRDLFILENDNLNNLVGLNKLTSIERTLKIRWNSNLTSLTGLDSLTNTEGSASITYNNNLSNLTGLDNLTSVGEILEIEFNNSLSSLTGLGNLVSVAVSFDIVSNHLLTNLVGLDNLTSVGQLYVYENNNLVDLTGLESINSINHLTISGNENLVSLESLKNLTSTGGALTISRNPSLNDLIGLDNITSLGGGLLIILNSDLHSLADLDNITSVGGDLIIGNNDSLTNLIGLHNVASLNGNLEIVYNDGLNSLAGLENIDETTISGLEIFLNPNLAVCGLPNICTYLANGGIHEIYNNASTCTDDIAILNTCGNLGKIEFSTFYDINQNKIQDNGEPDYNDAMILVESTNSTFSQNLLSSNTFYREPDGYVISYEQSNSNWELTTDSMSYFISLEQNQIDTVYFGLYPNDLVSNILPTITSPPTRCNETITFDISTKNLGTTTASGILWLEVDENILATNFIDTPDTTVAPNRYGWFFDELYPSYSVEKEIALQIPGPPDFPVGDLLEFNTYANFEDENGAQTSSTFTYTPEVRCSYDPNDKLINPAREGDYALFDEDLIYTVRFQNTGNDVAYDVVILDTLDANLDRETFRLLGSSHTERLNTSMDADGVLTFEFRDIFLPDSTSNFEGSQGYVSYLIRTIDGLAENTPVTNSAGIYFDLNPPVITNTVQSVMVSELPTVSVQSPDNELDFNIIPNPNIGTFYVQGATNGAYRIFNAMGQVIYSGLLNKDATIDISQAASGIYFIEIREEERVGTRRFVKQ